MSKHSDTDDYSHPDGLSDRDLACHFLADLDYDSQLRAIVSLLDSHRIQSDQLSDNIKEIEESARHSFGLRNEQAVDEWLDRLHTSVYQDAAHSMAAVGMLAPFVESIFHQGLLAVGQRLTDLGLVPESEPRFAAAPQASRWDCHIVWRESASREDLVEGILQLSDAVGLSTHLPGDIRRMLTALFQYRNKMFHNGFEWPKARRDAFDLNRASWPREWFSSATRGTETWIIYLADPFVRAWIDAADGIITGLGKLAREVLKEEHLRNPVILDYSAFMAARHEKSDDCDSP